MNIIRTALSPRKTKSSMALLIPLRPLLTAREIFLQLLTPIILRLGIVYDNAGLLEKIQRKESGGLFTDVVSSFDYSPMGQVATQTNANGTVTTNTYDRQNFTDLPM